MSKKKKYKVIVREVLGREVEIEADSFVSGSEEAFRMYDNEELVKYNIKANENYALAA